MKEVTKEVEVLDMFYFLQEMDLKDGVGDIVLEGSTRSGKTYAIIMFLIWKCMTTPNLVVRCFRHNKSDHSKTSKKDFLDIMKEVFKIFKDSEWHTTNSIYKFANGSTFCFEGTNDIGTLHGCKQDIAWLEEVMNIHEDAYTQIGYRTNMYHIHSFNPSFSQHYVFNKIMPLSSTAYMHSTYKDNKFLTNNQIAKIEAYDPSNPTNIRNQTADEYKWNVYGLGKRGHIKGSIYKLFDKMPYSQFPNRSLCNAFGYGLDFGSSDETAMVECRLWNNTLYFKELIYEKDLQTIRNITNPDVRSIEQLLMDMNINKKDVIIGDCAARGSIRDLRFSGYNIIGQTNKSVNEGINNVRRHKIVIDSESVNLLGAMEGYRWKVDSTGAEMGKPNHDNSHLPDAFRYWCTHVSQFKPQGSTMKSATARGSISDRLNSYRRKK